MTASRHGKNALGLCVAGPWEKVTLPTDLAVTAPFANLQVTISSTNGDPVFGGTAQTEIDSYVPFAGDPAVAQLSELSGAVTFAGRRATTCSNPLAFSPPTDAMTETVTGRMHPRH